MATEYLDKTGLVYFWGKIKAWVTERFVSDVLYDSTGHKITKTKNGSTSDVVTLDTIIQDSGALTASDVVNNGPTLAWSTESTIGSVGGVDLKVTMPANPDTDTKNTAGATDTSSKIFIIGATSQGANPLTYSHDTAYVGTDGCLYSGGNKILVSSDISNKKNVQAAVSDPTASGTSITFIDTITQNTNGDITPTKKTVSTMGAASASAGGTVGLVPASNSGDQDKVLSAAGTWVTNTGDTKVTLSAAITTNGNYPVILGYSTATTSITNTVNKSSNLTYNPSTKAFVTGGTVDGYDLNDACAKAVDSSISENSTSTNLPTSQAVANAIANAIQSAQVGAAMFQGLTDLTDDGIAAANHWKFSSLSDYKKGWYWVVASSGTYTGKVCEAGDMIFCVSDKSTSYSANDFNVVQTNLDITLITTSEIDTITSN